MQDKNLNKHLYNLKKFYNLFISNLEYIQDFFDGI